MKHLVKSLAALAMLATTSTATFAETAKVNGGDIYYETTGEGPAILMMHGGLGLSHDYFRPYFDTLAETNTVVYYDHFGNGRSGRPDDYSEMTFDRLVSDAEELMTQLGHEKFTLIGHSYGGFVAQAFAAQSPDRLEGLVLIDTVPAFDYQPTLSGPDESMAAIQKLFSQPLTSDEEWRADWGNVIKIYFKNYPEETGADLDARTVYEHRAWNAAGALLGTFNMLEELPDIETPSLVIAGKHDGITPPEPGAERIGSLLPNAKVVIFEDSAHYPFIEEEAAFFKTLKDWLNR